MVLNAVFSAFSLLIMTLYFLAALPSMKRQAYRLVPATRRERVTLLSDEVINRIGGFISGALTVAFIAGADVVHLPADPRAAVRPGTRRVRRAVRPHPAGRRDDRRGRGVAARASPSRLTVGIVCVVFYVAYQQFENYVVYPRVMRRAVDVPAPVTVVAVLLGGALLGVVGALLAIPIAAAVLLVIRQVAIPRMDRT